MTEQDKKEIADMIEKYAYDMSNCVYDYCCVEYMKLKKEHDELKIKYDELDKERLRERELAQKMKKERDIAQNRLKDLEYLRDNRKNTKGAYL